MRAKVAGASSSVPSPQLATDEQFEELDGESDGGLTAIFYSNSYFFLLCVQFSINFMFDPPCAQI